MNICRSISTMTFTSSLVQKNINNSIFKTGDLREAYKKKQRKFCSPAWCKFLAIYDENNALISSFVVCKLCRKVFKSGIDDCKDGKKGNGTSNLLRHSRDCTSVKPKKKQTEGRKTAIFWNKKLEKTRKLIYNIGNILLYSGEQKIFGISRCFVCYS